MLLTDFSLRLAKHTWLLAPYQMISIVISTVSFILQGAQHCPHGEVPVDLKFLQRM